jgi:glycosyltransferase involved in cell wall biosynthesis
MKTIVYDYQAFMQKWGGVSRYFYELIMHSQGFFNYYIGGIFSKNHYADKLGFHKYYMINQTFKGKWRLQKWLDNLQISINNRDTIKKLKHNCDIYHPTYYEPYLIDKTDKPIVLTVYDMIHELTPNGFPIDSNAIAQKKTMMLNATKIIAISENTRKDILKLYPKISEDKISTIHLATSWDILKDEHNEKQKYILYTGTRHSYKNFNNFILAIAPLLIKYNLQLKCTGASFTNTEIGLLKQQNIFEQTSILFANEDELKKLYVNALCFVFPSSYEGFGIPILEAFACGCPLVLSNTSCFPEIAGNAGIYFDPNSIEDMQKKIDTVICSDSLQKKLANIGFERLKMFSWQKCAEETARVYENA